MAACSEEQSSDRGQGISSEVLRQLEPCAEPQDANHLCGEVEALDGHRIQFRVVPAAGFMFDDETIPEGDGGTGGSEGRNIGEEAAVLGLLAVHQDGPGIDTAEELFDWLSPPEPVFSNIGEEVSFEEASHEDEPPAEPTVVSSESRILPHFDVVAITPRGSNAEEGLDCGEDETYHRWRTERLEAELELELSTSWIKGCEEGSFGAVTVASDLATVLDYLDAPRTVMAGYSYGGLVGTLVAQRHPDSVDAVLLDGPTSIWNKEDGGQQQIRWLDERLAEFFTRCDESLTCFFAPGGDAEAEFRRIFEASDVPGEIFYATILLIFAEARDGLLDEMMVELDRGDLTSLTRFADLYHDRTEQSYPPGTELFVLSQCADALPFRVYSQPELDDLADTYRSYGVLGEYIASNFDINVQENYCDSWAGQPQEFDLDLTDSDVPVLVLASMEDLSFPWEDVVDFAENSLHSNSATLSVAGYESRIWRPLDDRANLCVSEAVDEFLASSTLPAADAGDDDEDGGDEDGGPGLIIDCS